MFRVALLAAFLFSCTICIAQDEVRYAAGLKSDNDSYLFYGQDRYYTNGLFLNFSFATDQSKLKAPVNKRTIDLTVAQKMYNPYSGNVNDPRKQDRPFAAYLYAGGSLNTFYQNEGLLKLGLQVGVVGESAFGKESQEIFHDVIGFYEVKGWEYAIRDAFAFNLSGQYTRLLAKTKDRAIDVYGDGQVSIGSTYNGVGVGLNFRAGRLNELFNSAATNSIISRNATTPPLKKSEFYFYARPAIDMVLTDATIQGGISDKSSPVTFGIKRFVFSQQAGFNYSTKRFTLDYRAQFNSREIKSRARPHQFGSILLMYRFN